MLLYNIGAWRLQTRCKWHMQEGTKAGKAQDLTVCHVSEAEKLYTYLRKMIKNHLRAYQVYLSGVNLTQS